MIMTACLRHVRVQTDKNPSLDVEGRNAIPPLIEELLAFDSFWERESQFSLMLRPMVGQLQPGKSLLSRLVEQHRLFGEDEENSDFMGREVIVEREIMGEVGGEANMFKTHCIKFSKN